MTKMTTTIAASNKPTKLDTILSIKKYKSIFWLLFTYIKTLLKLINHPEINCNMSIPSNHYFSNIILFDYPSSGINFLY